MKVIWIPIFSMRSYDTGKYAICKDGNFQLTFARILASDFESIIVTLPDACSDFQEFMKQNIDHMDGRDIKFRFLKYGANAVDTRKNFWELNRDYFYSELILEFDLLITDITGYTGTMSYDIPYINNFNVTKLPELDRPYIDEFFETDLKSMENALFTTVINPRQREYILEVAPHLAAAVIVDHKVAHWKMIPSDHRTRIHTPNKTIFWPFRISDKAYKFKEFLEMYEHEKLYEEYDLVITDPNDTYSGDHSFVRKIKPTKAEYYTILGTKPIVIMLDDIDTVLHPGTIEFLWTNCRVITMKNKLVNNYHQIDSIEQIPQKLAELQYNNLTNVRDFIYGVGEVSTLYNEGYVSQCVQNF